jgi:hypothetical protein
MGRDQTHGYLGEILEKADEDVWHEGFSFPRFAPLRSAHLERMLACRAFACASAHF